MSSQLREGSHLSSLRLSGRAYPALPVSAWVSSVKVWSATSVVSLCRSTWMAARSSRKSGSRCAPVPTYASSLMLVQVVAVLCLLRLGSPYPGQQFDLACLATVSCVWAPVVVGKHGRKLLPLSTLTARARAGSGNPARRLKCQKVCASTYLFASWQCRCKYEAASVCPPGKVWPGNRPG